VSRIGSLRRLAVSLAVCALLAGNVSGQSNPELSQAQESLHKVATTETAGALHEEGVPVTDPLVIAKCGSCHARDDKGNMERISWARTTPEGWQNALKRMILVKGVSLTAQEGVSSPDISARSMGWRPRKPCPSGTLPSAAFMRKATLRIVIQVRRAPSAMPLP